MSRRVPYSSAAGTRQDGLRPVLGRSEQTAVGRVGGHVRLGGVHLRGGLVPGVAAGGRLRERDLELAAINRRLVAATEERARYMLRTTHQLKAPFAAIHANTQLLLGGYCGPTPGAARRQWSARSPPGARCCRGKSRRCCSWPICGPTRGLRPAPAAIDLAAVDPVVPGQLEAPGGQAGHCHRGRFVARLGRAVHDHAVMIVDNILSNAINYSLDGQRVSVSCRPAAGRRRPVVVRDRGIGIPAEKLPRIFDDYFHTSEAVGAQPRIDRPGAGDRAPGRHDGQDRRARGERPGAGDRLFRSIFPSSATRNPTDASGHLN